MRIIGIDPGLGATGYGVVDDGAATDYGVISTPTDLPLTERLRALGGELDAVLERTRPGLCALETLFFKAVGARSVIRSAESRGAILYVLGCRGIPVQELTPATIKLALTGSGRASKTQMNYMAKALLKLDQRVPEHAADALAAAWCLSRRVTGRAAAMAR